MGIRRNIPGGRISFGFLLTAAFILVLAAIFILVPMSSDDSDAGEVFTVGDYQYEVITSAALEVKVSAYADVEDVVIPANILAKDELYAVKEVANGGFADRANIRSVTLPEGVEVIGSYAFSGCTNLSTVSLPISLTKILQYSFCNCSSLESIWIRLNVSTIEYMVFYGCTSLKTISVDVQNEYYMASDNVLYDKDRTRLLTYPLGKTNESYFMPNTVVTLDMYCMYHAKFKNLTLSSTLTTIGESSLEGASMTSLTLPKTVATMGDRAIIDCKNLQSITVEKDNNHFSSKNGVLFNSVGNDLVLYPAGIDSETYTIPLDVKNIKEYAFYNNTHLQEVYLRYGVSTLGKYCFSGCTGIVRVEMPSTITSVGEEAYAGCTSLRSVAMSSTMTTISVGMFRNCTALETLYITSNISVIKEYAFSGCTGMKSLYIPSSIVQMTLAFSGFTFYSSNRINTITSLNDIRGHTYMGTMDKMYQEIGTYSLIHYRESGGSIILDDQMRKHNEVYVFPNYTGVRQGFNFTGWEYNGNVYKAGATMTTPTNNSVMTAVWTINEENNKTDTVSIEVVLSAIITIACVPLVIFIGILLHKRIRYKAMMKEDDDTWWQKKPPQ